MKTSILLLLAAGLAAIACTEDVDRQSGSARRESAAVTTATETKAHGFVEDIDALTTQNRDFRRVVYTSKHVQVVLMSLKPGEDIGAEVHDVDQFFRVEAGTGEVVINDRRSSVKAGSAIVVPAGARHNVINTGKDSLQVYTLYAPPQHRDKVVHHTKADAQRDSEHFDGTTTE